MFYRLIYSSRAKHPIDFDDIVRNSQRRNVAFGVTGGLAIVDDVFLQYLEGTEAEVEWLFERISADERHTDVRVLERRAVPRRMFGQRSMAMLSWVDETQMIFQSFSPDAGLDLSKTDPTTAAPLFRAWAATSHWHNGEVHPSKAGR